MSRIASLVVHVRPVPLVRPFVTAVRTATALDCVLVEIRDTDGRSGWGEAPTSWRVTGESPESVRAAVDGPIASAVVGLDPTDTTVVAASLERAVFGNGAARMAVDCAVHDLAAQIAGRSLHDHLAGAAGAVATTSVRTDMTLSAATDDDGIDELVATAVEHVRSGFDALKIKVGAGADDVRVLREVRAAIGPGVELRTDANQAWDAECAVAVIRAWEDEGLDIAVVEQPVGRRDLDGLAAVTAAVDTPVLADESLRTLDDLAEIVRRRAADMVNVKLAKTGGISHARKVVSAARSAGMGVLVGCMLESHVGIAAAAALAASLPSPVAATRPPAHDLDAGAWLASSPVVGGVRLDGPRIGLAEAPGLGITAIAGHTAGIGV